MSCPKASLYFFLLPFAASITMPVRYAHRPAFAATRSRNAISRFRLPGFLRTRNDSLRRWLALLSHVNYTAAKAAVSLFRPALKRRGYQAPEFLSCGLPLPQTSPPSTDSIHGMIKPGDRPEQRHPLLPS
jgi:hypothetical protein